MSARRYRPRTWPTPCASAPPAAARQPPATPRPRAPRPYASCLRRTSRARVQTDIDSLGEARVTCTLTKDNRDWTTSFSTLGSEPKMPDLSWNTSLWGDNYGWEEAGEEWSVPWGGSEAQWYGSLFPRLHRLLPASSILEIAPGYGRWTRFLLPNCERYLGIDLHASCVEACRNRFSNASHARFASNDGLSLAAAPDASFDVVFSFDSLVHAEIDVLQAYVAEILRKLKPGGTAFIHHSNYAQSQLVEGQNDHSRAHSVSASAVADLVSVHGG